MSLLRKSKKATGVSPSPLEEGGAEDLLESILDRDNLNMAYKRVKANKGAPGIDGMTVEDALPWLKEHGKELIASVRNGTYKPQPVRRKEIPKEDGSKRKLGIPTVIDRLLQQAIMQKLAPIFEVEFSDGSYGYRPGRSCHDAIKRVKGYVEEGYTYVVEVDLSKYFDTLNHDVLMELLRKRIKDRRVLSLIKKFLKSGVMENGIFARTEEGSPQGGPLSPLLANIYLNEYDKEMEQRGVKVIRYADDIVVMARSQRAAERLLLTSGRYLEGKLKLKVNQQKSKAISVYSQEFKFLGFRIGKVKGNVLILAHPKSLDMAKRKLKEITRRNRGHKVQEVMKEVEDYMKGWLGYFAIASIKGVLTSWNQWLRRRFRMYLWKQWKRPKKRIESLRKLGIDPGKAYQWGNSRLGHWRVAGSQILSCSLTNKELVHKGYYDFMPRYESLHSLHLSV